MDQKVTESLRTRDALLSRPNPLHDMDLMCHPTLKQRVESQAMGLQYHHHSDTCFKGKWGGLGCRLNMACALLRGTHPVLLVVRRKNKTSLPGLPSFADETSFHDTESTFNNSIDLTSASSSEDWRIEDDTLVSSRAPTAMNTSASPTPTLHSTPPAKRQKLESNYSLQSLQGFMERPIPRKVFNEDREPVVPREIFVNLVVPPSLAPQDFHPGGHNPRADRDNSIIGELSPCNSVTFDYVGSNQKKLAAAAAVAASAPAATASLFPTDDQATNGEEEKNTTKKIQYDIYDLRKHPLLAKQYRRYRTKDILDHHLAESVVVWETNRPPMKLPPFLQGECTEASREAFIAGLKSIMVATPPFNKTHSAFWKWIDTTATQEQLGQLHEEVIEKFIVGNGLVASFNPAISFCTGSHNNVSLLGSLDQAKSAMFYLIPYQGKTKFPIEQSLTVIDSAIKHCKKYESKTVKDDKGTIQRTTKQILARTLNQMHLRMELSDYQVVSALIELPSMIQCDTYEYGNPGSLGAFRTALDMEEDRQNFLDNLYDRLANLQEKRTKERSTEVSFLKEPKVTKVAPEEEDSSEQSFIVDDKSSDEESDSSDKSLHPPLEKPYNREDILGDLGYTDIVTLRQQLTPEEKDRKKAPRKIIVPRVSHFYHRGESLKLLNYYEYLAVIKFKKEAPTKSRLEPVTNNKYAQQYQMDSSFEGFTDCHHAIKIKQNTPLLIGKSPRHPGTQPHTPIPQEDASSKANRKALRNFQRCDNVWHQRADAYARYYLLLFRPERIIDNLSYTWEDLVQWIEYLKYSTSVLSKFRLMMMDNHMKGMRISSRVKKMTLDYRGRARHLWTQQEREEYNRSEAYRRNASCRRTIQERFDAAELGTLSAGSLRSVQLMLQHDFQQRHNIDTVFQTFLKNNPQNTTAHTPVRNSMISTTPSRHHQQKNNEMKNWKYPVEDEPPSKRPRGNGYALRQHISEEVAKLQARGEKEAAQQLALYNLYAKYFQAIGPEPPRMVLLHGGPGVGKSMGRDSILRTTEFTNHFCLKTAIQAINALQMPGGKTTAHFISANAKIQQVQLGNAFNAKIVQKLRAENFQIESVVFVEEVSLEAPWHIAQLCRLCQLINGNFDEPFGGAKAFFTGDLSQLPPVIAGKSIAQAVMDIHASAKVRAWMTRKRRSKKKNPDGTPVRSIIPPIEKGDTRFRLDHPYGLGVDIMTSVRWYELTQQQRSRDDLDQLRFNRRTYLGENISMADIQKQYKIIGEEDFKDPDFAEASVIVSTNREKYSLTHARAIHFAHLTGTIVIRWLCEFKDWTGQPESTCCAAALEDPCFYEYFVEGARGFITKNIMTSLYIVNGTQIKYHSIKFDPETEEWLNLQIAASPPGSVITAPCSPIAINVEVFLHEDTPQPIVDALKEFSLEEITDLNSKIIVPIVATGGDWNDRPTPVYGSSYFGPSKVLLRHLFPVDLSFAITVHKSQGQTLPRIIIALSVHGESVCTFAYEQLHVAFSRVCQSNHIRLLLTGNNIAEKWQSISYVNNLRQDPAIKFYFAGFRPINIPEGEDPNHNWITNVWSAERANEKFLEMIDRGQI